MNYVATVVLHLTRAEFYRMNPGLFFDMVQVNNRARNGGKNKEDIQQ